MNVTFLGHKDTPSKIQNKLKTVLTDLIITQKINMFYVGNQGSFDYMVLQILNNLREQFPQIRCSVVLAYLPIHADCTSVDYANTIFPEELENTLPKFAISKRNCWLIDQSDIVITYVTHPFCGAYKFKELAKKKGKHIIELSE